MKIVVLAKEVPDTYSDRELDLETGQLNRAASEPAPDEINERTVAAAVAHRENGGDVEIVVLMMAPETCVPTARKLLAIGADSAVVVSDPRLAGADYRRTAGVLATAISRIAPDLVLAGDMSTDGGGGVVPAMVAELLGLPVLPSLDSVTIGDDGVRGSTRADGETLELSAPLPAVALVGEKAAAVRFPNFREIMRAKKKSVEIWTLDDLGEPDAGAARSVMVSAAQRPAKVAGPKVVDDGTAAEQLADFLATRHLL